MTSLDKLSKPALQALVKLFLVGAGSLHPANPGPYEELLRGGWAYFVRGQYTLNGDNLAAGKLARLAKLR